jgi:hypothetical protein
LDDDLTPYVRDALRLLGGKCRFGSLVQKAQADRLNLWRVGVTPERGMLSTEAARNDAIYGWSRQVYGQNPRPLH